MLAILTAQTCGDACWHAKEEICRCSCFGKNHGILNKGGSQPGRTCRIDGNLYELVSIIPGRGQGEAFIQVIRRGQDEVRRVIDERFPGLDWGAYGLFMAEKTMPVLERKLSKHQSAKWAEVQAIPNAYSLIWARPVGTRYLLRAPDYKHVYSDGGVAP